MPDETLRQSIVDEEHLKLLSLGYMVSGGFAALFSFFGLLYLGIGLVLALTLSRAPATSGEAPPAFIGWIFAGVGLVIFLVAIVVAIAKFWAASSARRRKSRTICMVVAGISCLEFPYGTLLGVATFIVLGRPSVMRLFTPAAPGPSVGP